MQVELLHLTPDALNFIGNCAGICYDAKRDSESNIKRAINCSKRGHLATLRFAHATFHVSGISRACSHQFVRSKHLDFLQQSQRYVNQDKGEFIYPPVSEEIRPYLSDAYQRAKKEYNTLLMLGIKKEDARYVLPEGMSTELVVTGNLQAWMDFISLRSGNESQAEIREVAITINEILYEYLPEIF
jgi:thymidylate synthase (FAD)